MIIGALHEKNNAEKRILLSLETVKKLSKEKLSILIAKGYGLNSNISDQELIDSGATIETEENILKKSDVDSKNFSRRKCKCKLKNWCKYSFK